MIDKLSEYLAHNKAMPVFLGVLLVILNYGMQFLVHMPVIGFIGSTNLLLHLGVIVGLLGILLGDAL
jgi:hypothetical protein